MGYTPNMEEYRLALNAAMGLCAVMIVFNLVRSKTRGLSALLLASAFAAMGALLYGLREGWPQAAVITCAVVLVGLLIGDALARFSKPAGAPKP